MVELEVEDYNELFDWFTLLFGKGDPKDLTLQAKRTFWKLNFLSEDKLKEMAAEDDDDGDVEVAPASPTPEAPDMHALADFLEDRIGVLFGQQVAPALNAVNEKIDRMQGQIDSHVESDHKPAETPVHVVQCPEAREALKEEEERDLKNLYQFLIKLKKI